MTDKDELMSFGGHLEVFRQMLFRILGVTFVFACIIFCLKAITFDILLGPRDSSFVTYRAVGNLIRNFNPMFQFESFDINLIATDVSSQFVTHITTSIYLGLLCASPFIMFELFRFVSPALNENEKKYSNKIILCIYFLFILGVLMSYYILFPISFRFLGTYSVEEKVQSMISLDSYISLFISLTLIMGVVFQLPVIAFILTKMGILNASQMAAYRKHAIVLLAIISAIITPPDIMTLILVCIPLYGLYELSILIMRRIERPHRKENLVSVTTRE